MVTMLIRRTTSAAAVVTAAAPAPAPILSIKFGALLAK